jgi:hypothetical protein
MYHTLKNLRSVEGLLLLEQPNIASNWNASDVLAVCAVPPSVLDTNAWKMHIRIREGNALIVSEVWSIILTLPSLNSARYLCNYIGRTLVRAAHVTYARSTRLALSHTLNALGYGLERVLHRIIVVGIRACTHDCLQLSW